MDIFLVRHAKSAHDHTRWKTDDIRPLADIGRERQTAASYGMKNLGLKYTKVWVSPFKRAQQTLEIIQEIFGTDFEPRIIDQLKVWGDPHVIKNELATYGNQFSNDTLLIVGHNPNMSDLVDLLTNENIYMRTSDLVHIKYNDEGFHLVKYYSRKSLINT